MTKRCCNLIGHVLGLQDVKYFGNIKVGPAEAASLVNPQSIADDILTASIVVRVWIPT